MGEITYLIKTAAQTAVSNLKRPFIDSGENETDLNNSLTFKRIVYLTAFTQ